MLTPAEIAKKDWYRQGSAARALYLSAPIAACLKMTIFGERIPVSYAGFYFQLKDDRFDVYLPHPVLRSVADEYVKRQKSDATFAHRLYQHWRDEVLPPVYEAIHSAEGLNLSSLSDEELLESLAAFTEVYERAWNESIFHDAFDLWGEDYLLQSATNHEAEAHEAIGVELLALGPSVYQQERIELLQIAEELREQSGPSHSQGSPVGWTGHSPDGWRNASARPVDGGLRHRLEDHANRYRWIQTDYQTIKRLTADDFARRVNDLLSDQDHYEEERALRDTFTSQENQAGPDASSLRPDAIRIAKLLAVIAHWRDARKAMNQRGSGVLNRIVKELSRRTTTPLAVVEYMHTLELVDLFTAWRPKLIETAKQRRAGVLYSSEGGEVEEQYVPDYQPVLEALEAHFANRELGGRVAFPGVARGQARLVLNQQDFPKFQHGDILVAPNTRPEYLPLMRKAAAVVTEEGGLTSHAAIVARELKKPTIVGVQGVTLAIADGDTVEVNADEGIIRKVAP